MSLIKKSFFLLGLATANQLLTSVYAEGYDANFPELDGCFDGLRDELCWPLENSGHCDVSSVFGPSLSTCFDGEYKFNRGITIHGEVGSSVYPSYDGVVEEVWLCDTEQVFYVMIKHELKNDCTFGENEVTEFYTTYGHLRNKNVEVGDNVKACETELGVLGRCAMKCGVSLSYVLELGASCSLFYHNTWIESRGLAPECNGIGMDPHINPWYALPPKKMEEEEEGEKKEELITALEFHEKECWGEDSYDGRSEVQTLAVSGDCGGTDINMFEIECTNGNKHVLDLNYRRGFDASSPGTLHSRNTAVPYLDPKPFTRHDDEFKIDLVIPNIFFEANTGDDCCIISVTDIWGNKDETEICGPAKSYVDTFDDLRNADPPRLFWPTPDSDYNQIFSSFGPRSEEKKYAFHNGVDIKGDRGDEIVAIAKGKVTTMKYYNGGGNTIMIQHDFDEATKLDTSCGPGEKKANFWFTQYQHLDRYADGLEVDAEVEAGQLIGYMGSTGEHADVPFLHYEVRFGTKSSLKYALDNPDKYWSQWGYDPMIHGFLTFPKEVTTNEYDFDIKFSKLQGVSDTETGIYQMEALAHNAGANTIKIIHAQKNADAIKCYDHLTYSEKKSYTYDLNLRVGFQGPDNELLEGDALPKLAPVSVGDVAPDAATAADMPWKMNVEVPPAFMVEGIDSDSYVVIFVRDVWGDRECRSFKVETA